MGKKGGKTHQNQYKVEISNTKIKGEYWWRKGGFSIYIIDQIQQARRPTQRSYLNQLLFTWEEGDFVALVMANMRSKAIEYGRNLIGDSRGMKDEDASDCSQKGGCNPHNRGCLYVEVIRLSSLEGRQDTTKITKENKRRALDTQGDRLRGIYCKSTAKKQKHTRFSPLELKVFIATQMKQAIAEARGLKPQGFRSLPVEEGWRMVRTKLAEKKRECNHCGGGQGEINKEKIGVGKWQML